jgi:hypothetical protein
MQIYVEEAESQQITASCCQNFNVGFEPLRGVRFLLKNGFLQRGTSLTGNGTSLLKTKSKKAMGTVLCKEVFNKQKSAGSGVMIL